MSLVQDIPYLGSNRWVVDYRDDGTEAEVPEPKQRIGIVAWAIAPVFILTSIYAHQMGTSWIPQIASLVLAALWLTVDVLAKRRPIVVPAPFIVFFTWMLWEMVGNATDPGEMTAILYGMLSTVKVFLIALVIANIVREYRGFIPLHMASALTPTVLMLVFSDSVAHISDEIQRGAVSGRLRLGHEETGEFGNSNALAFFAVYSLISAVCLFLIWKGNPLRWLALASIPPIFTHITYTGSRSGMATTAMTGFAFWFFYLRDMGRQDLGRKLMGFVLILCIMTGLGVWILTSPFAYRFFGEKGERTYGEDRGYLAIQGLRMFTTAPLTGHGMFGFNRLAAQYNVPPLTIAHCLYVDLLIRGGIPGFLLYYCAWFLFIRELLRLRRLPLSRNDRIYVNMMLLYCTAFFVNSFTGTPINPRVTWMTLGAAIGYTYGLRTRLLGGQPQEEASAYGAG